MTIVELSPRLCVQGHRRPALSRPYSLACRLSMPGAYTGRRLSQRISDDYLAVEEEQFRWTVPKVALSIFLFLAAGLCEIGGGWLIWQGIRGKLRSDCAGLLRSPKAVAAILCGSIVLVGYGFLPTLQPPPNFGRLYAVYGGFFIVLSYLWGWIIDHDRPDKGDCLGAMIALVGVALAWFWPR